MAAVPIHETYPPLDQAKRLIEGARQYLKRDDLSLECYRVLVQADYLLQRTSEYLKRDDNSLMHYRLLQQVKHLIKGSCSYIERENMSLECHRLLMQAKDLIDEAHQHFQRRHDPFERGYTFSVEKYCYEPLEAEDTIRLLEFENEGGHMGFVRCRMKHVRLTDEPIYEALSYAWGDPIPTTMVICNGRTLDVSVNLESALVRLQQTAVPFWIDAICINQTNNAERSKQVKMMSAIYRKASRVNIWLGGSDGETWAPLSLTYSLLKIPAVLASTGRRNCLEMSALEFRKHLAISGSGDPALESFFRLMMRPWFRRIWIIQEVAVSREAWVWCGRYAVQWKDFALALKYAKEAGLAEKVNGSLFERVSRIELVRQEVADGNSTQRDLHHLLLRYYDFLATNPKDKVYAVLGLAKEPIVNVDYDLDDRQVYIDAAVEILRRSEDFDLLGACRIPLGYTRTALLDLPSWVPDWSVSKPFVSLRMQGLPQEQKFAGFSASGRYVRYPLSFSDDQQRLCLYGHFADKIELGTSSLVPIAAPALAPKGFEFSYLDFIRQAFHMLQAVESWGRFISQQPDDLYITGDTVKDAVLQTICCGQADDNFRNQFGHNRAIHRLRNYILANALRYEMTFITFMILYNVFYLLLKVLCCINIHEVHSEDEDGSDDADRVTRASPLMVLKQAPHLFSGDWGVVTTTSMRYFSLVPSTMFLQPQRIYMVGVFQGCKVPLILSPVGDGWELIGECYVHGIMHGEAFNIERCEKIWVG